MMKNTRAQNQIHGLTRQTEVALIKRARTGDVDARNSLMEAYYATAKASCRRHAHKKGVNQEDADSEIFFAIAEAINGDDLRRNVPFAAYLDQRARGAITWTHRESKKQDLRKLTEDFHKRFGGSGPPGKGREPQRRAKEPPVRMSTIREGLIANYINFQRGSYFVYPVHVTTRKSFGLMMRKLSVTESRNRGQFRGTLSRRNPSVASANWAQVA